MPTFFKKHINKASWFINRLHIKKDFITNQAILCNKLLSKFEKQTSYLEIGVDQGLTFEKIDSKVKHGVDPYGVYEKTTHRMTSEMFFALNKLFFKNTYDLIFIDGSHLSLIVDKEIEESLNILNKDGYIVLHDTDPSNKKAQELVLKDISSYLKSLAYPYKKPHTEALVWTAYNGDVWRSIAKIRMRKQNIQVFTIENFCCTVLTRDKQKGMMKTVAFEKMNWNFFIKNRKKILNPIEFKDIDKYL